MSSPVDRLAMFAAGQATFAATSRRWEAGLSRLEWPGRRAGRLEDPPDMAVVL